MEHVLFAVAIFIANIIQGLTGFAGSLLAMPPSINILGLIPAKVAVNTFSLVSSVILFVKNFRKLEWKEAVKIIILMGLGLGTGIAGIIYFLSDPVIHKVGSVFSSFCLAFLSLTEDIIYMALVIFIVS